MNEAALEQLQRAFQACLQDSTVVQNLWDEVSASLPDELGFQVLITAPPELLREHGINGRKCHHYVAAPVLVCYDNGKIQKYPSLAKAQMFLPKHLHWRICSTPIELNKLMDLMDLEKAWGIAEMDELTDETRWQYCCEIAEEKNPWDARGDVPTTDRLTKAKTAAGYTISHAACKEFADAKAPKQAKVIAASFLEHVEDGSVMEDVDIEKLLQTQAARGVLNTKQPVKRIFGYYRPALLDAKVITLRS